MLPYASTYDTDTQPVSAPSMLPAQRVMRQGGNVRYIPTSPSLPGAGSPAGFVSSPSVVSAGRTATPLPGLSSPRYSAPVISDAPPYMTSAPRVGMAGGSRPEDYAATADAFDRSIARKANQPAD